MIFTFGSFSSATYENNKNINSNEMISINNNKCEFDKVSFKFPKGTYNFPDKMWYSYGGCNGYLYYSDYAIDKEYWIAFYSGKLEYAPIVPLRTVQNDEK